MTLAERFEEALTFATRLHATQTRKGGDIPYIAHLLGVTSIALEYGATEDQAIAALLHDAMEDQGGRPTLEKIREKFGPEVADIVEHCSDSDVDTKTGRKKPWRQRKKTYIENLSGAPPSVLLVSAADKLHNARTILADYRVLGDDLWPRFNGKKKGTL